LARASALHAEGHRFDSDILHQNATVWLARLAEYFSILVGRVIGSTLFTFTNLETGAYREKILKVLNIIQMGARPGVRNPSSVFI
jgi:hypothetical protein